MSETNAFSVQSEVRQPWRRFLDDLEPIRPELHRYCLGLTGNVWDGEDLLQEALVRVFSLLGKTDADLKDPRAYLIRTATNLWIDRMRRHATEHAALSLASDETANADLSEPVSRMEAEDAIGKLFNDLSAKERAAFLMKDVLDLSLEESASMLQTSVAAVKASLNRGRDRLFGDRPPLGLERPPREVAEAFVEALSNLDIEKLRSLCAADMSGDLVGGVEASNFDEIKPAFEHAHFVMQELGFGQNPWWEVIEYRGEPMVAGYRTLNGVEGLNEIHRFQVSGGKITRIRIYCFCPDTLRVVGQSIGKTIVERPITPYRSPSP